MTGGFQLLGFSLFSGEGKWLGKDLEQLVPARLGTSVFFSDVHQTHTLFTILRVFGEGLEEA